MSDLEKKVWERNRRQMVQQNKHLHSQLYRLQQQIELLQSEKEDEKGLPSQGEDLNINRLKIEIASQDRQLKLLKDGVEGLRNQQPVQNAIYIRREEDELTLLKKELHQLKVQRQLVSESLHRKQQTLATNQPLQLHKDSIQEQWASTKKENREISLKIVELERQERKLFNLMKQSKEEGNSNVPSHDKEADLVKLGQQVNNKKEQIKKVEAKWKPNLEVLDKQYFSTNSTLIQAQSRLALLQREEAVWKSRAAALRGQSQLQTDKNRLSMLPLSKAAKQKDNSQKSKTPPQRKAKTPKAKPPPVEARQITPQPLYLESKKALQSLSESPKNPKEIKPFSPKKVEESPTKVKEIETKKSISKSHISKKTITEKPEQPLKKDELKAGPSPLKHGKALKGPTTSAKTISPPPKSSKKGEKASPQRTVESSPPKNSSKTKQILKSANQKTSQKESMKLAPPRPAVEISQNASNHTIRREKAKQGRKIGSEGASLAEQIKQKVEQVKHINTVMEKQQRESPARNRSPSPSPSLTRLEAKPIRGKSSTFAVSTPAMAKTDKLLPISQVVSRGQQRVQETKKSSDRYNSHDNIERKVSKERVQSVNLGSLNNKHKEQTNNNSFDIPKQAQIRKTPKNTSPFKSSVAIPRPPKSQPSPGQQKKSIPLKVEKRQIDSSGSTSPRFNIVMSDAVRGVVEDVSEGVVRVIKRKRVKGVVSTSTATVDQS